MGTGFAENLKELRREKKLSQEELAELLDVSRQAVSKWEAGKGYPEVEKLLQISEKLDVSLDALMSTGKERPDGRSESGQTDGRSESGQMDGRSEGSRTGGGSGNVRMGRQENGGAGTSAPINITIISPHENVIVTCYKVEKIPTGRRNSKCGDSPHFALSAVSEPAHPFWGQPKTFLGWYADEEQISREMAEIKEALERGEARYELKYSVKAERKGLRMKIVDEREEETK